MTETTRSATEWVNTADVIPNPLNPRKNNAIKTDEIQEILSKRGFEIPLTVYQRDKQYIVLSGHRRLFAAKQMNVKQIPVFVVPAPENFQEEIERIASLQKGHVEWTPYEWAKFCHEQWIAYGRPAQLRRFGQRIGLKGSTAEEYIYTLEHYKRSDIEYKLVTGVYSFSALAALVYWLRHFREHKAEILKKLGEAAVEKIMRDKIERKVLVRTELRNDKFVEFSTDEEMMTFLKTDAMSLTDAGRIIGLDAEQQIKTFQGHLISMGQFKHRMGKVHPKTKQEHDKLMDHLSEVKQTIELKMAALEAELKKLL